MTKPVIRIYTAADEYIDREMNAAELAQYKIDQENYATKKAQEEARANQRQALLDKLGITAEEATLLLS